MKTPILLATVLALAGACSSTTADRPSTNSERHAAIERDRAHDHQRARAEHDHDLIPADEASQHAAHHRDHAADHDDDVDETAQRTDAAAHAPDNTGRNERDTEPGNLTALDQSNSSSDVDITQAIRKKVVADDALSFNAKNVKIITVSGKVTLRGPVANAKESKAIEQSARAVPGVVHVDNQIEVER